MAVYNNNFLLRNLVILILTGLACGDVFDKLLDDNDLLLYLAIGFLFFSVLFLFVVILMITIVAIRIKKLLRARDNYHDRNDEVIANSYVMPLSERRLTDSRKWDQYFPEIRNGRDLNSATNVDYLDYMDMIIMDASKVTLPRARTESSEKTI